MKGYNHGTAFELRETNLRSYGGWLALGQRREERSGAFDRPAIDGHKEGTQTRLQDRTAQRKEGKRQTTEETGEWRWLRAITSDRLQSRNREHSHFRPFLRTCLAKSVTACAQSPTKGQSYRWQSAQSARSLRSLCRNLGLVKSVTACAQSPTKGQSYRWQSAQSTRSLRSLCRNLGRSVKHADSLSHSRQGGGRRQETRTTSVATSRFTNSLSLYVYRFASFICLLVKLLSPCDYM